MRVTRWCIDDVCRNAGRCMWAGERATRCPAEARDAPPGPCPICAIAASGHCVDHAPEPACTRCGGTIRYSGEHRLGGEQFTCGKCGTTYTY